MKEQVAQEYVGRNLTETGLISTQRCAEIFATFGWTGGTTIGAILPHLCHWCAFSPVVPTDNLGTDGHPGKGTFLPDIGLERRMWASGKLEFLQKLHVGEILTRNATIEKVDIKEGSSGKMAFVTVAHEVSGERGLAIRESQSIVYLAMPDTFEPPAKRPMPEKKIALLTKIEGLKINTIIVEELISAAKKLEQMGWIIEEPKSPNFQEAAYYQATLWLGEFRRTGGEAVSYTHLTLPTKRIV